MIAKLAFASAQLLLGMFGSLVKAGVGIGIDATSFGVDIVSHVHRNVGQKIRALPTEGDVSLNRVGKVLADTVFKMLRGVCFEGIAYVNLMPCYGNLHRNLGSVVRLEAFVS
jgi:hypothetical protein